MYKKCKVIILPTNKKVNALRGYSDMSLLFQFQKEYTLIKGEENYTMYFHLYILSDDSNDGNIIKKDDWYLLIPEDSVRKATFNFDPHRDMKKIIATTESTFNLHCNHCGAIKELATGMCVKCGKFPTSSFPFIPQSFIEYYISEYNKGNKIEEVMIEYEIETIFPGSDNNTSDKYWEESKLKLNSDNTISIKPIKDSWTRNEVIELCKKAIIAGSYSSTFAFNDWIESNL